ncbi:MAG: DUF1588 domain-containing protein, partial [Lentisphaeraceae bacterium]|nr:DUF1588 domain-containing protein [Lentisphaeraceae bacterium]
PEDSPQASKAEIAKIKKWYSDKFINIKPVPAKAKLTRLSTEYYRNSIRTLLGFDLTVNIAGTPETVVENSLILKIMPPDPPGSNGFSNDTAQAPITETLWEKYHFIANSAVEELFSSKRKTQLVSYTGLINNQLSKQNVNSLITKFTIKAFKTNSCKEHVSNSLKRITADLKQGISLEESTKKELKTILVSPQFLYYGKYNNEKKGLQTVDQFAMAQRLSYFLWATIPDEELLTLASKGQLNSTSTLLKQVDRMLDDKRSKVFTELFAREWLALDEMKKSSLKWPLVHARYYQPIRFVDYLIRENRPIMEIIDSKITFANQHLKKFYAKQDAAKIDRLTKAKGVEVITQEHNKIRLDNSPNRGGILTMPGILSMYSGKKRTSPILRGVWILERILGDELGEVPMDVPVIEKRKPSEKRTFRQIFEEHQNAKSCAVCHHKIDPIGFGLENYDHDGQFRLSGPNVNSAGITPNGDKFKDFSSLKKLLIKRYDIDIIHNLTEKFFVYALARGLQATDRPIVDKISNEMIENEGTYRDLIKAIVTSWAFTHTIVE